VLHKQELSLLLLLLLLLSFIFQQMSGARAGALYQASC